jgi:hypothetical protein
VQQQIRIASTSSPFTVVLTRAASLSEQYPAEIRRWTLVIGTPMLLAASCVALAIGTSLHWMYGGVVLFGPGMGVAAIIYLSISTDTNGIHTPVTELASPSTRVVEATAPPSAA